MAKKLPRGFYWRGGVIWVRTDPITGKPSSTRCHAISAAKLWREERERLAASPTYAASILATVGKWVEETIAHVRSRKKSQGTLHMYGVKLGHVNRIFGADNPMASITPQSVDAYIAQRQREKVKSNTIARELTCLRQMLKLARRAGEFNLEHTAVMPVGFAAGYEPVKRTLPIERVPELLAALPESRRAWVCFAIATAGDISDVERARPEDYDPVTSTVRMRGTKNAARTVPVPVLPLFEKVFLYAHARLPVEPWPRVSKDLPAICKRLGIGHISPKDLRRSASTWLVEAGVEESQVSRFMRHKNNTMVRTVYGQVRPQVLGGLIAGQLQSKNLTAIAGPLAEQADAGDLKGAARGLPEGNTAEQQDTTGPRSALVGALAYTKTSHRYASEHESFIARSIPIGPLAPIELLASLRPDALSRLSVRPVRDPISVVRA